VYVLFDADRTQSDTDRTNDRSRSASYALISEMRAHNEFLREQLQAERDAHAETRRLLAGTLERIPSQLEAAPDARQSPGTPSETPANTQNYVAPKVVHPCTEQAPGEGVVDVGHHPRGSGVWLPAPLGGGAGQSVSSRRGVPL
jgi:hypothetical protein